jgi:predicted RNA binding protein YcfA (HicA-like mRNA interferase family)
VKYRDLLRLMRDDGWKHMRTNGSHMMFEHAKKRGPVVVPAGGKEGQDVPQGTLNSILKQTKLK